MTNESAQVGERCKSLYFADGNVVISASREGQSGLLFRVHKSVLSSHSRVFADMFQICITSAGNEADSYYDGVPLIHLSDDADDLAKILEILYYQSDLPWVPRSPHYPALATPILNLSRKYAIDRLYAQVVRHLESDWPQTLKDWDKLEREIETIMNNPTSGAESIDDHFPEPAAAIKLARQFDIPSILPAAFYHLSRLSILDDWEKIHADPSIGIRSPTRRTARWELLSAQDFRCLLLGKAELAEYLRGSIHATELRHVTDIRKREYCEVGARRWKDIVDRCIESANALAVLKNSMEEGTTLFMACHTCASTLKTRIPVIRAEIWQKIGVLMHLKDP